MQSQTLDNHTAHKTKLRLGLPTLSKAAGTALRLILIGAMLVVIGLTAWDMLRAEMDEAFRSLTVSHAVDPERTA